MTRDEARRLFSRIAVVYPYVESYIVGLPDAQATIDAWCRILMHRNAADAEVVIGRIESGTLDVPLKPWELGRLGPWLNGEIGAVATKRSEAARQQGLMNQGRDRNDIRPDRRENFATLCRIAMAAGQAKKAGDITPERNDEIVEYLCGFNSQDKRHLPVSVPEDVRQYYVPPGIRDRSGWV